jgi:hypothetical protein
MIAKPAERVINGASAGAAPPYEGQHENGDHRNYDECCFLHAWRCDLTRRKISDGWPESAFAAV